ncbi:alpha/beta fold hydrolase [Azospirillum thermophilum]|uniref:Alpha/beta hydrolase n=1 Tax=Azospirillum thermophilum TaxID=2202148 RepID=A0A2S2CYZ7_9PROT|nr:alpha/beta hydrolase [Azospirillum thermophilum]AWK89620.1 alpha/beta hydrolase [Azospirillum thermophilum]
MAGLRNKILERLNVGVSGSGTPVLVLAPGFGTNQAAWRHVAEAFGDRYRIVLLDLAGLGPDDRWHYDAIRYSRLEAYAEDLLEALQELGIAHCDFVGHSVAGMVGALAAIREPQAFRKLVMLGSSARYLDDEGYRGGFTKMDLGLLIDAATRDYVAWSETYGRTVVSAPPGNPTVREFVQNLQEMRPDLVLSILLTILNIDLRARLPELRVPTVVLQTRHDPAVSDEAARYLHEHIAGSVMEVLDAAGHLPHLTAPALVVDALRRHLD